MHYLVLSEAALLLLLVVDSESELDLGRRGSFLYTRKLSVTGWFPPSNPLLGKPARTEATSQSSLVTGSHLCAPVRTREQVFVVTIAVRSGATAGASGSLPLPDCCEHWQLRGADRTLANACSAVASIAVLGWPPRPFGRPGHFLVLLGEENRCPTSHLWS